MEQVIHLPFYRTVPTISNDETTLASIMNYDPYFLFCLDSQLQNLTNIVYSLVSEFNYIEQRMYWTIKFTGDENDKSNIQIYIDQILNERINYFPIWTSKGQYTDNLNWEKNVIVPYIEHKYPNFIFLEDMILATFEELDVNFKDQVKSLQKDILNFLIFAKNKGYISCDQKFVNKWSLIQTDIKGLYKPSEHVIMDFYSHKLNIADFLFDCYVFDEADIIIPTPFVESVYVKYHNLSKLAEKYNVYPAFIFDMIVLPPTSPVDLILDIVRYVPLQSNEVVYANVVPCTNQSVKPITNYIKNNYNNFTTYTRIDDKERPFYISFITNQIMNNPLQLSNEIGKMFNQEDKKQTQPLNMFLAP